jgi:hypothetical protein
VTQYATGERRARRSKMAKLVFMWTTIAGGVLLGFLS